MTGMLPLLSAGVAALSLTLYVLLDGFDLGVGVLLLTTGDERLRDAMVETIAPVWDGNETWLIMAGVTLLAAFPLAYGVLLPAFYLPLLLMLMALGCRGVSFEFRVQPGAWTGLWDCALSLGSAVAALCQGVVVGALLEGVSVTSGRFAGTALDVLRPFPLFVGVVLLTGYVTLGAGWVLFRADGALRAHARRVLEVMLPLFAVLGTLAIGFAPEVQAGIGDRWEAFGTTFVILTLAFVALLVFAYRALRATRDSAPFTLTSAAFGCALIGLVSLVYPDIIPFRVSLWDAASPTASHVFLLIGVAFVMPVVLAYSYFAYYVFRGKVSTRES